MNILSIPNYKPFQPNNNRSKTFNFKRNDAVVQDCYIKANSKNSSVYFAGSLPYKNAYLKPAKDLVVKNASDIGKLEQTDILVFMAHPDDEVFFAAIPDFLEKGYSVRTIYTTPGQWGHNRKNEVPERGGLLGKLRESELVKALNVLRVNRDPVILGAEDGQTFTKENANQISSLVTRIIKKTKPKYVFSFGPEGITQHHDHINIGEIVFNAVKKINSKKADKTGKIDLFQSAMTTNSRENMWKSMTQSDVNTDSWVTVKPTSADIALDVDIKQYAGRIADSAAEHKSQWTEEEIKGIQSYYSANNSTYTQIGEFPKQDFSKNPWEKLNEDIFGKKVDFDLYLGNSEQHDVLWVQVNNQEKLKENIHDVMSNLDKIRSLNYLFRNVRKIQYASKEHLQGFKKLDAKTGDGLFIFEKEIENLNEQERNLT